MALIGTHGHASGGHVRFNIGPVASIGAGGEHAGRVVGLVPALKLIGNISGPIAAAAMYRRQARDFNDEPVEHQVGVAEGRTVRSGARGARRPPPSRGAGTWSDVPFTEDDEDLERRAHQAGKENRAYYHRMVGTPKHRPIDTSDLRRGTP